MNLPTPVAEEQEMRPRPVGLQVLQALLQEEEGVVVAPPCVPWAVDPRCEVGRVQLEQEPPDVSSKSCPLAPRDHRGPT